MFYRRQRKKRRLIPTLSLILFFLIAFLQTARAQDISVTNFYYQQSDQTANEEKSLVRDQNGNKCALIRVQTTQKGFVFDVGSLGIAKTEDNHVGEIWLWVPEGVRHISIRHQQLGSLPNYDFPIKVEKARTYIMEITHGQVFVNNYDDSKKQTLSIKVTPFNAKLFLNGMSVELDSRGEATREMAHGQFTYKIEAPGYYPKEGQVTVNDNEHSLVVNDLKPIMGKLSVHVDPYNAAVSVDDKSIGQSTLEPVELQIGSHEVTVALAGYRTEKRTVEVKENETADVAVTLVQQANFNFVTKPSGATVYVNGESIGSSPCTKALVTGTYSIKATKNGYKDFVKTMKLDSSNPQVNMSLKKTYVKPNEFYIGGDFQAGSMLGVSATLGAFIHNINVEASYAYGLNAPTGYWNSISAEPVEAVYTPAMNVGVKVGYGIVMGTRMRLTPQIGIGFHKISESLNDESYHKFADGSNVTSGMVGLRFSMAVANHLSVNLTPEYSFAMNKSKGFEALSLASSQIKGIGEGFNVKLGIAAFF